MRHTAFLHFIHTDLFEESAAEVPLTDAGLRGLQDMLRNDPEAGDLIKGTGGVRKIRIAARGRGSRGGARVIYYYVARRLTVYLLLAYAKGDSDDLTPAGKQLLRQLAKELDAESCL